MKQCSHCKERKEISEFVKDRSSIDGHNHRCKECTKLFNKMPNIIASKARSSLKHDHYREYGKKYDASLRGRFTNIRGSARWRNLEFSLTMEFFEQNQNKVCFYCGEKPRVFGLDRINNNLGYTEINVAVCCEICNWMKVDMKLEDFINHCNKISTNCNPGTLNYNFNKLS